MSRLLLVLLLAMSVVGLVSSGDRAVAHDPPDLTLAGDSSVRKARLPWQTDVQIFLTQGWNSPPGVGSHQGQYATDWANASNTSFWVLAATEGDATCTPNDGDWGNRIDIARIDGKVERYAHLASCPFGSSHMEQGDLLAMSSNTGVPSQPIHLHYEMMSGPLAHCLSQFCPPVYFDDVTVHREVNGEPFHHHHPAIADNAGPGYGLSSEAWTKIRNLYVYVGHILCAGKACDCFGSSLTLANSLTYAGDPGWQQLFQRVGGALYDFAWPTACDEAYWIPDEYYSEAYYWYAHQLGQPRSNVETDQFFGYVQKFRYGFIYSPQFGQNPSVYLGGTFTCS